MLSKFEEKLWFRATFLSANDMYGEVEKVIFLANEITKEKDMEMASRSNHEQLIRKEEELRIAGLDLRKKLEDSTHSRKEEKARFEREVKHYTHVLNELPHSMIRINNLGFVLFLNRSAGKLLGVKEKDILGKQVKTLFGENPESSVVASFCDPAKSKTAGSYSAQNLILLNGENIEADLLLVRTDLKEELFYSLLIHSPR